MEKKSNQIITNITKKKHLTVNTTFLMTYLLWLEILFRLFVFNKIRWSGLFYNILFNLAFILLFTAILVLIKQRYWNKITNTIALIACIFYGAQHIYNAFFKKLFTWYSMFRAGQVTDFMREIVVKILRNIPVIILFALPFLIFAYQDQLSRLIRKRKVQRGQSVLKNQEPSASNSLNKAPAIRQNSAYHQEYLRRKRINHNRSFNRKRKKISLVALLCSVLIFAVNILILTFANQKVNSAFDLYFKTSDIYWAADRFGLMPAMRVDLRNLLFPSYGTKVGNLLTVNNKKGKTDHQSKADKPAGSKPDNTSSDVETPSTRTNNTSLNPGQSFENNVTGPEQVNKEIRDQILPIDFDALIKQTEDPTILEMHQYFSQVEPSRTNDHTGIFKGYNLIFLTAEGYSRFSPNPDLTPTLWHMQENGYKFTNFYNPLWGVSTSDGEYTGITGLSPKPGVWSMLQSAENNMALVPGNMLRRLGYYTTAWHNHSYDYYGRDQSHPNLGYVYKGLGNGLDVEPTWPESDLEMMQKTLDIITQKEPFHAYYMTVSGHMQYNYPANFIADINRSYVENLDLGEPAQAYMATQIELDKALEYLLKGLREKGLADHTLIVLNADHYPYGLEKEDYDELAGHEQDPNFEIYKNSLLIYVDGMQPEVIDRPCFPLDILPTIYNLMGVPFDSRLLMGTDIFSDKDPLIYFANRSWITDQGKYDAIHDNYIPAENSTISDIFLDDYIAEIQQEVINRSEYSSAILDYDYYNYLFTDQFWDEVNKKYY